MTMAVLLTFGSVEATAVLATGSPLTIMDVDIWKKIKALPNAKDIIRCERKSEFNYCGAAHVRSPSKEKIIAAASLNCVLAGASYVIDFHIVKSDLVDVVLGYEFVKLFSPLGMTSNYIEWRRGSETNRAYFLRDPELKVSKVDENGRERAFMFSVQGFK